MTVPVFFTIYVVGCFNTVGICRALFGYIWRLEPISPVWPVQPLGSFGPHCILALMVSLLFLAFWDFMTCLVLMAGLARMGRWPLKTAEFCYEIFISS